MASASGVDAPGWARERNSLIWRRTNGVLRYGMLRFLATKLPLYTVNEYPKSGGTWLAQMLGAALGLPFPRNRLPVLRSSIMHGHYLRSRGMHNVVVVWRDGRDVMVSFYFHCLKTRPDGLNAAMVDVTRKALGSADYEDVVGNLPRFIEYAFTRTRHPRFSWSQFAEEWGGNERAVHVRYEDLLRRGTEELQRIVEQLTGRAVDEAEAAAVVEQFSFESQTGRRRGQEDQRSFLRKGIAGDWVNYFSPEAREVFNHYAGRALTRLGYEPDGAWADGG